MEHKSTCAPISEYLGIGKDSIANDSSVIATMLLEKNNRVLAIGRKICFRKQSDQFTKRNHLLVSIVVPAAIQLIQIKCVLIIFDGLNFNHKFLSCLQFEFLLQKSSSNSRERAHK